MGYPKSFNELEWNEDTIPTIAHIQALYMALYERTWLLKPMPYIPDKIDNSWWDYDLLILPNAPISRLALFDFLDEINYRAWEIANKGTASFPFVNTGNNSHMIGFSMLKLAPKDFIYNESVAVMKAHLLEAIEPIERLFPVEPFVPIDYKEIMRKLIQLKNIFQNLTNAYAYNIYPLDKNRQNYSIYVEGGGSSFTGAQELTDNDGSDYISAYYSYSNSHEVMYLCLDGEIYNIFPYDVDISVFVYSKSTNGRYYDFGTGLKEGWNDLGTFKPMEHKVLLPKNGFGNEKLTAVPPGRGTDDETIRYEWSIKLIKFDFSKSFMFK